MAAMPQDDGSPVFREPWEAHAFALAVQLSEAGCFSWSEWTAALAREIRAGGDEDGGEAYYRHWLNALERLCVEKALVHAAEAQQRREEWRQAYLHTPHGQPVVLATTRNTE
jgi:nitrile hydratase accessory protein